MREVCKSGWRERCALLGVSISRVSVGLGSGGGGPVPTCG